VAVARAHEALEAQAARTVRAMIKERARAYALRPCLRTERGLVDSLSKVEADFDRLIVSHKRLRASRAELLAAAVHALAYLTHGDLTESSPVLIASLKSAIARAEESAT
jgi:hypothetical protein